MKYLTIHPYTLGLLRSPGTWLILPTSVLCVLIAAILRYCLSFNRLIAVLGLTKISSELAEKHHLGAHVVRPLNEDKREEARAYFIDGIACLLYTSPSPRDRTRSRMPSSA